MLERVLTRYSLVPVSCEGPVHVHTNRAVVDMRDSL